MNKRTRQLVHVQDKVVRLTVALNILKEKKVDMVLLSRRVEEIQRLKDSVGL